MCGLVGVAGNCQPKIKDTFTELLLVDVVRGAHSTGTAIVDRATSHVSVAKAAMPSPYFIGTNEYKDLMTRMGLKAIIGHNRFATVGEKTAENAHPFEFPSIVGAHNGTLDNWALKNLQDWAKFGTDSAALYNSVEQNGLKETISQLSGAWALTYYDAKTNTMNLLRNNKRPLFYAYSSDRETLFWASEANMLEWVVKRNNITLFEDGIFECTADHHYKWTVPEKISDKFEKPVVATVEGRSYTFRSSKWTGDYGAAYGATHGGYDFNNPTHNVRSSVGSTGTASVVPLHGHKHKHKSSKGIASAVDKKIDTKKFRPPYKDAYGRIINKVRFEQITKSGCVFCDNVGSQWGDFIFPLKNDMDGRELYLCEECYNDDDVRELIKQAI